MPRRKREATSEDSNDEWEQDAGIPWGWEGVIASSEEEAPRAMTSERAGREFADLIVNLYRSRQYLTAKSLATLCYFAVNMKGKGFANELAMAPGKHGPSYSKHINAKLREPDWNERYYDLPMPCTDRFDSCRAMDMVPALPLHEAILDELETASVDLASKLAEVKHLFPPIYQQHPVVRSAPHGVPVYAFTLFLDGVALTRVDGTLGVFAYNWLTRRKHLLLVLRKMDICHCGCKGWCSLFNAFVFLRWSAFSLARGELPFRRHDKKPWLASDRRRQRREGEQLNWRGACVLLKNDLLELSSSWGFPSTGSLEPCIYCHIGVERDFLRVAGMSPLNGPFRKKTMEEYLRACDRCEIVVHVATWSDLTKIRGSLIYNDKDTVRGRGLNNDLPEFNLKKNDRLEPTLDMLDVGEIDAWKEASFEPATLNFWRRSAETYARHRNPFLEAELGTNLESFAVDWLHSLSLGPMNKFLARFCMQLFTLNCWRAGPAVSSSQERLHTHGVQCLKADLFAWYADEQRRGILHTRVQNLTDTMFTENHINFHGSECNHFLKFCLCLWDRYHELIPNAASWLRGLRALDCMLDVCHTAGDWSVSEQDVQNFCEAVMILNRQFVSLDISGIPKNHFLTELAINMLHQGSPKNTGCWHDEAANKILKGVGTRSGVHRRHWALRTLDDFRHLHVVGGAVRAGANA